ncbi:MAG: DNA mismatch repair endonuclease MutL [Treponema sp.]|jgi:DNA mismatch repair protein MutL|nr:DNA mismatch repair endonuclease MutL [Treponema sp.]
MGSRIQVLPPEEARKIAAGEVVDRPAALVREFLDNAIDAGGTAVELQIDGGGIRRVETLDDGIGMSREDLAICWQAHATSKIRSLDDLGSAGTLGFRGEALAAAAAVSRLEILTCSGGAEAWRLVVGPGAGGGQAGECRIEPFRRTKGTSVRALGLFDTIPARKRFLKREGSEAVLCRQIFIEKAMAFPALNFRFTQDGAFRLFFPAVASRKERFADALLEKQEGTFLHEIYAQGEGFQVTIVVGGPELFRSDRRHQYIFANGRRIQDYSMIQALEYGTQGWFPNGTHPVGAVYIDVDPSLADFNIHPAKREARFRDSGAIHHSITTALRDFLRRHNLALQAREGETENRAALPSQASLPYPAALPYQASLFHGPSLGSGAYSPDAIHAAAMEALLDQRPEFAPLPGRGPEEDGLFSGYPGGSAGRAALLCVAESRPAYGDSPGAKARLAGRLFKLFLLVEKGDRLFIIDQHAAHERILYDRFLGKPVTTQELLAPIPFSTDSEDDDAFLESHREYLGKLGIVLQNEDGGWLIEALPAGWQLGDGETVEEILKLKTAGENIAERWAATLSCHAGVKDGDYLDDAAALELAEAALALEIPRCPHGRPIWVEVTKADLFRLVQRT